MSLLDITDTKSFKDEIVDLAKTLAKSQTRLQQLVLRLEEREQLSESLETRYEELQKSRKDAVNSAKWLNAQNKDLQFKLDQSRPEIDRLLSARESAFKRLKHARKVIRDLLEERGDMSSPRTRGSLSQEEINEALNDDFQPDDSSSSTNDSASDKTVRLSKTPSVQPTTPPLPSPGGMASRFPLSVSPSTAQPSTMPRKNATPSTSSRSVSTLSFQYESMTNSNVGSPQRPVTVDHTSSPNSNAESPDRWHIQYSKPPGSRALDVPLPIQPEDLQATLDLDDDTMQSLESIMTSSDISMRLHIARVSTQNNVAFLYDPIFSETRRLQSHILDWGRQQTNQNLERHILQHQEVDPIFHVFIYPVKQQKWFYIGPMNWFVVEGKKVWPLEGNSRTKIINKLCRRSRGQVDSTEMEKLLDGVQLQQVCVEMQGVNDDHDFARRVFGNRQAAFVDSRHTERSA